MYKKHTFIKKILVVATLVTIILPLSTAIYPAPAARAQIGVPNFTGLDMQSIMEYLKQFVLDKAAVMIANQLITKMSNSIVSWINSGFKGSPAFLQNPEGFFADLGDQITGQFIAGSGALSKLCSPYGLDLRLNIALQQANGSDYGRYTCTLSTVLKNFKGVQTGVSAGSSRNGATIGDILSGNVINNPNQVNINNTSLDLSGSQINMFVDGNFQAGGWPGFLSLTTEPQNNAIGSYLIATDDLRSRIGSQRDKINTDLNRGGGFMSWQSCKDVTSEVNSGSSDLSYKAIGLNNVKNGSVQSMSTGQTSLGMGTSITRRVSSSGSVSYQNCETQTPGSIVGGSLQRQLNVPADKLVLVKTISDAIDNMMNALVNQMISKGIGALSGAGSATSGGGSFLDQQISALQQNQSGANSVNNQLQTGLGTPITTLITQAKGLYDQAIAAVNDSRANLVDARTCFQNKLAAAQATTSSPYIVNEINQLTNHINAVNAYISNPVDAYIAQLTTKRNNLGTVGATGITSQAQTDAASSSAQVGQAINGAAANYASTTAVQSYDQLQSGITSYQSALDNNLVSANNYSKAAQSNLAQAQAKADTFDKKAQTFQNQCATFQ